VQRLELREGPMRSAESRLDRIEIRDDPLMEPVLRPFPKGTQQREGQPVSDGIELGLDPFRRRQESHVDVRARGIGDGERPRLGKDLER
jgi:hypothetical protein